MPNFPKILLFILFFAFTGCCSDVLNLTITNKGFSSIDSLQVHVTGNSYAIGSIAPGQVKSVNIEATGESHIELTHADNKQLLIDVYFEPGYTGSIHVDITPDSVSKVEEDYNIGPSL